MSDQFAVSTGVLASATRTVALELAFGWLCEHLPQLMEPGAIEHASNWKADLHRALVSARENMLAGASPSLSPRVDPQELASAFDAVERRIGSALDFAARHARSHPGFDGHG